MFPQYVRQNTIKVNNTHREKTTSEPRVASRPLLNDNSHSVIRMHSKCQKRILTSVRPTRRLRRELLKVSNVPIVSLGTEN